MCGDFKIFGNDCILKNHLMQLAYKPVNECDWRKTLSSVSVSSAVSWEVQARLKSGNLMAF